MNVELYIDAKATLAEGPFWHPREQRLYWVDITEGKVHIHEPNGSGDKVFEIGCQVGAAVPRAAGGLMLATERGLETFSVDSGEHEVVCDPESDLPNNRFNDGKVDPAGRFWAGTMSMQKEPKAGSFYCFEVDGTLRKLFDGVTVSNGLDWSPDAKTMYHIDSPTREVVAFDYCRETGEISNRRVLIRIDADAGVPDGMTVDAEGALWIAHWDGARVTRWSPEGELLDTVPLPAQRVTSCAFGGEQLDVLYITTAQRGLDDETLQRYPHSGGIFALRPGVKGMPTNEYAG